MPDTNLNRRGLGRIQRHDPRNWNYPIDMGVEAGPAGPVLWRHHGRVNHQGATGSCTGNALAHLLATGPYWDSLKRYFYEPQARDFYHRATMIDDSPGTWPPDDTGSDGGSVAKVAQSDGLIGTYRWAFGYTQARSAIARGPLMFGTVWTDGMFEPDSNGLVWPDGDVAGGHEYLCIGYDRTGDLWTFMNSWAKWGDKLPAAGLTHGAFRMTGDVVRELLSRGGDVVSPDPI